MRFSFSKGFTLIELLIVIAVLGILATVVIVAVDPSEQFKRSRDAGRKSAVKQLGQAITAYQIAKGSPPLQGTQAIPTWMNTLVQAGDLKTQLPEITNSYNIPCWLDGSAYTMKNYCYNVGTSVWYVWTNLESKAEIGKCASDARSIVFYVYDSGVGSACIKCVKADYNPSYNGNCNSIQ